MSRGKMSRSAARFPALMAARQSGFTLMELMVGMTIGLLIIGAALVIFGSGRMSSETAKEQSRLEDSTRYVQRMMQSEVGQAGFFGCVSRGPTLSSLLNAPTSFLYNFAQPVYGHTGNGSTFSPAIDSSLPTSGAVPDKKSDILVVRGASSRTYSVATPYPTATGAAALVVSDGVGIARGDLIAASNCTKTVIFTNTGADCPATGACSLLHATGSAPVAGGPSNATLNLGVAFAADSEVTLPITTVYYIAVSSRCQRGSPLNCPMSSLWRKRGVDEAQEMIEGVDRMKVLYRVDNGIRGGGKSMTASEVTAASAWDKVVGADARFTLTTLSAIGTGPQTIDTIAYTDRRVRRLVEATVNLRNLNP